MATVRNKRNLAAVSGETPENTRNNQSQNTLVWGWLMSTSPRFVKKSKKGPLTDFPKILAILESRILGVLSKIDEFLLSPQVRTCSVAVLGTSRNNNSEKREPTVDRSLNDLCPEVVFSICHTSNLNDSVKEETHHNNFPQFPEEWS